METTTTSTGRRTAATWVAATGAFLLLAAAGVFVSVRWDDIPDAAKLGVLFALTGSALFGGLTLRRTLPATGDVLVHLGAFLLAVDVAASSVRLDTTWGELLVAEGLLCGIGFAVLARWTDSVVLRWSALAGAGVLAAGLAAVTPLPAPVVLVVFAALALVERDDRSSAATWWAAIAGLAPVLVGAAAQLIDVAGSEIGGGTIRDLGFDARSQSLTAWAVGLTAAAVLGVCARRRDDVAAGFLAITTAVVGVSTSIAAARISGDITVVAVGGVFLSLEVAALVLRDDDFWRRPSSWIATAAEVVAVPTIVLATIVGLLAGTFDLDGDAKPLVGLGVAVGVAALGWLAADLRWRPDTVLGLSMSLLRGGGRPLPNVAFAGSVIGAAAIITVDGILVALVAVAVAAFLVLGGRPGSVVVTALVTGAVALGVHEVAVLLPAIAVCTWAAALHVRNDKDVTVGISLAILATYAGIGVGQLWAPLAAVAVCWAIATALDVASPEREDVVRVGDLARAALVVPLLVAGLDPLVISAIVVVLAIDSLAWRRVELADAAAAIVPVAAYAILHEARVADPQAGIALCITAIVWSGLAVVVGDEWKQSFVLAACASVGGGLALAAGDATAFADSVVIAGSLIVAAGLVTEREAIAHLGGVLISTGVVLHLGTTGVDLAEPYLVPVAAHLALAGYVRRRRVPTSSWVAYVPAIALLGGSALVERIGGGGQGHVLVVAAVGTLAVALGGWQRLVGPLLTGTALLVVLTAHESLGALAGIPTWTWLAVAGTALLGTGVALERTDTSPVDAGRRLVDVMNERFE